MFRSFSRFVSVFAVCLCTLCVPAFAYDTTPPSDPVFTGCLFVSGSTRELGDVVVYLPLTYQKGYLSYDGFNLFNVTNSSVSGRLYAGSREYDFRCSSWSNPEYRVTDSGYYQYESLTFTSIDSTNIQILEDFPPLYPLSDLLPLALVALLGVIVLCLFIKRF